MKDERREPDGVRDESGREDRPGHGSASSFILHPSSFKSVFLVGPRGSGKSTVAALLAGRLGWRWLDADALLEERAGQSIRALFAAEGEPAFRQREAALLAEVCAGPAHVVATGGGVVLRDDNRARLRQFGLVVWLKADVDSLWARISGDAGTTERRPALGVGGRAEVADVVAARQALYAAVAHHVVDTTGRGPAEVCDEIAAWLAARRGDDEGEG
jgi:shikimate kinase